MAITNTLFRHSFRLEGKEIDSNLDHIKNLVPYVNAKEYGVTGDGVTDDRANIQLAIDSMTSGGTLYFPTGTYRIGTPGLAISSNMTLLGEAGTIFKATDDFTDPYGNGAVLQNYTPPYASVGNTNICVDSIKIDGNQLATRCIIFQGGSNLRIVNCHTIYPTVAGAHLDVRDFSHGIIDNNFIEGNEFALGINCLGTAAYVQITNNRIVDTLDSSISIGDGSTPTTYIVVANNLCISPNAYGIDLFGKAAKIVIANNLIKDAGGGGTLSSIRANVNSSVNYPYDIVISNNVIQGGTDYGISLSLDAAGKAAITGNLIMNSVRGMSIDQAEDVTIVGNVISDSTGVALNVASTTRGIVANNMIDTSTGGYGMDFTDVNGFIVRGNFVGNIYYTGMVFRGAKNCIISDNVVKNCGMGADATFKHGIQIRNGTSITASIDNIINGNRVFDDQGTKTQDTGILTQQNSDFNLIGMNDTRGNKTADASVVGSNNIIGPELFTL